MGKSSLLTKKYVSTEMINSIILEQEKRSDEQLLLSVTTLTLQSSMTNTRKDKFVEFNKLSEKLAFIKNST